MELVKGDKRPLWPADRVERWPVVRLIPHARNARRHSEKHIRQIARAIEQWGWTVPILVDEAGGIIAGHGRVLAAQRLGIDAVPVMVASGWSAQQKRAYLIADNKLTENGEWDRGLLAVELASLRAEDFEVELTGFGGDELEAALAKATSGPGALGDANAAPPLPEAAITQRGDVWVLGGHRLLCGDATSRRDVSALFGGAKPNLMVTDPPYGVDYDPAWRTHSLSQKAAVGKVNNDRRADWREAWALFPGAVAYVWHAGTQAHIVGNSLAATNFMVRAQIVWVKSRFAISRGAYHHQHEPVYYAVREGESDDWRFDDDHELLAYAVADKSSAEWQGNRRQSTVWQIDHMRNETGHSTQKPIECMLRPILNNSGVGDFVYDPFVGSGTTLIAATMSDRRALALELDAAYCDVAVRRWQDFAQSTAKLQGNGHSFADVTKERSDKKGRK